MKYDCLLAGVGGQGTVLASRIIAQTAINDNLFARTSETIGMAQRGGCVVSHVRIDAKKSSPAIPLKGADLIIGFEPAEAVRNLGYLKTDGRLLVNVEPIKPVTASLGGAGYDVDALINCLEENGNKTILVDGQKLCSAAGSAKVLNVIMLGVAVKEGFLPFSPASVLETIRDNLPKKLSVLNEKAFETGYHYERVL